MRPQSSGQRSATTMAPPPPSPSAALRAHMRGYMLGRLSEDADETADFAPPLVPPKPNEADEERRSEATADGEGANQDPFEMRLALAAMPLPPSEARRKGRSRRRATVGAAPLVGLARPPTAPQDRRACANDGAAEASGHRPYKVLRALPDYRPGDELKKSERILCCSRDATAYALAQLAPGDCAFLLRSDGRFTYAIYEGTLVDDAGCVSFRVDDEGRFKLVAVKHFLSKVKVPVLPAALIGTSLDAYTEHMEEVPSDTVKKEEEEKANHRVSRRGKSKRHSTLSTMEGGSEDGSSEDDDEDDEDANGKIPRVLEKLLDEHFDGLEKQVSANSLAETRPMRKSVSCGHLSSAGRCSTMNGSWEPFPSYSQWRDPNSESMGLDGASRQSIGSPNGQGPLDPPIGLDRASCGSASQSSLSAPVSVPLSVPLASIGLEGAPRRSSGVDEFVAAAREELRDVPLKVDDPAPESPILQRHLDSTNGTSPNGPPPRTRVSSMQDLRRRTASLEAVPEARTVRPSLRRNVAVPPVPSNPFALQRNTQSVPSLAASSASSPSRGSKQSAGPLPRNVTLRRLGGGEAKAAAGANAAWEAAAPMSDNPLLKMVASRPSAMVRADNNPLLQAAVNFTNVTSAARPQAAPPTLVGNVPVQNGIALLGKAPLLGAAAEPDASAAIPGEVSVAREGGLLRKFGGSGPLVLSVPSTSRASSLERTVPAAAAGPPAASSSPKRPTSPKHGYSVGDRVSEADMPPPPAEEMKAALLVSKLKIGDPAFVNRSDRSYSFAVVVAKSLLSITFEVDAQGGRKTFDLLNVGSYVRVVDGREMEDMARRARMRDLDGVGGGAVDAAAAEGGRGRPAARGRRPPFVQRETWYESDAKDVSTEVEESMNDELAGRPMEAVASRSRGSSRESNREEESPSEEEKKDELGTERHVDGDILDRRFTVPDDAKRGRFPALSGKSPAWEVSNPPAKSSSPRSSFSIGDCVSAQDMPLHLPTDEMKMALLVSKLKIGDPAFVNRSDGTFSYSVVAAKNLLSITFQVTGDGSTKTFDLLNAGRYVRVLDEKEMGDVMRRAQTRSETAADEDVVRRGSDPPGTQPSPRWRRSSSTVNVSDGSLQYAQRRSSAGSRAVDSLRRPSSNDEVYRKALAKLNAAGGASNAAWEARVDPSSDNQSPLSPAPTRNAFLRVDGEAEDGGTTDVPPFKAGAQVYYKVPGGDPVKAQIVEAHVEDPLGPYYTIQLPDGREKQTDNHRISMVP